VWCSQRNELVLLAGSCSGTIISETPGRNSDDAAGVVVSELWCGGAAVVCSVGGCRKAD
jgi:hypothetical protein